MQSNYMIGLPRKLEVAELAHFNSDVISQLTPFLEGQKPWVFISGDNGRGKSYLAAALYKVVFRKDKKVLFWTDIYADCSTYFITPDEMLARIKSTYNRNSGVDSENVIRQYCGQTGRDSRFDDYSDRDWTWPLVIDDLGIENVTEHTAPIIERIIKARDDVDAITIMTSNLSLDEVARKYSNRVASRIGGNAVFIYLDGPDRRLKKA